MSILTAEKRIRKIRRSNISDKDPANIGNNTKGKIAVKLNTPINDALTCNAVMRYQNMLKLLIVKPIRERFCPSQITI